MQRTVKLTVLEARLVENAINDALFRIDLYKGRMTAEERETHDETAQDYVLSLEASKATPNKGKGKGKEIIAE